MLSRIFTLDDRSFFTTVSKDVRCHIGRGQSTGTKSKISDNGVGSERTKTINMASNAVRQSSDK